MKKRIVKFAGKEVGEMLCDDDICVFSGISEELEDMLYQGFYLKEHSEDPEGESYLAPDENGSKYFKLVSLANLPGVEFGPIEDLTK